MRLAGLDLIGAQTIPTAGADYTDVKTVTAVQAALVKKGYDLGTSGPNGDGVDGLFGSKTKSAIKKLQASIGADVNGRIDEGVIAALGVTPGVLPPGVTAAGRAAVQAQVALDAATAAEHANTPDDVQAAAQAAVTAGDGAAPPLPPDVRDKALKALDKAKKAKTPAEVQAAAADVKQAAEMVHAAVKPSWFTYPAWNGGPPRRQVAALGGAIVVLGGFILSALADSPPSDPARYAKWRDKRNAKVRRDIDKWRAKQGLPAHEWRW